MDELLLARLEEKWLNGTISEEEKQLYARWYNERQTEAFEVPETIARNKEEHREALYQAIENELRTQEAFPGKSVRMRSRQTRGIAISAAAILLLCLSILIFIKKEPVKQTVAIADLPPGRAGLVLTLSNGQSILVDTISNGLVAEQGTVRIMKRGDMIWYEGHSDRPLFNTAVTNAGRRYRIQLSDGSTVLLNAGSEIKYPVSFPATERAVSFKGEAYFDIARVKLAPFVVHVDDMRVNVLGTRFNISAYSNESVIATTLLEGSVDVSVGSVKERLAPGQTVVKSRTSASLERRKNNAENAVGWINNKFVFDDLTLADIMRTVERWYAIPIVFEEGVDTTMIFSGSTPMNQNLSEVMKVLSLSGVHCEIKDNKLVIKP